MRRSVFTIVSVAALSAWIARAERAVGVTSHDPRSIAAEADDWVRTAQGWQRRSALNASSSATPLPIHPALVAGFQIGFSLLVLVAFPVERRRVARAASASRS